MRHRGVWLWVLAFLPFLVLACRPSDPRADILKQRSRWTVDLLSWVEGEDEQVSLTVRVAGPPNSSLDELTFRVSLLDADNNPLEEVWRTADLSDVARGGPKDMFFKVDGTGLDVQGLAATLVLNPTPEQERHIKELQSLPPAGG